MIHKFLPEPVFQTDSAYLYQNANGLKINFADQIMCYSQTQGI